MSTRTREGLPGKEKTLPHQGNSAQRKASPNPSPSPSRPIGSKTSPNPSPSPSRPIGLKTKSPSSDKNVPSNLRSTKTRTSVDQPAQAASVKKPASATASSDKPSLAKGRSLNKNPPPASPSTRRLQSPDPKEKALRTSSSFAASRSTGTTAQKGASNRIVKTAARDAVKKYARPSSLKKSNNVTTKQNGESSRRESLSSSVMSSPERLQDHEIVNVPHPQEDEHQSYVTDEEVSINALSSHNFEVTADVVKEEDQQTETPVQAKPDIHEQEDIKIIESAMPEVSNQLAVEGSMKTEEAEFQNTTGETTSSFHPKAQQLQEQLEDNSTDALNENLEVQVEDQGKEEVGEATEVTEKKEEVKEEDQVVRETADVENVSQPELVPQSEPELKTKQQPTPIPAPAPAPEETKTVAAKHSNPVQAKKELSVVSNDTIEETASKLQEQRRNRVRALAGAFESVMQK